EFLGWPLVSVGLTLVVQGAVMVWGSKYGKLRLRDRLIHSIEWRGDEQVLDVGCGHGLMLIAAAKQLSSGKATGIDLWQKEDQAGNSREATWRNVEIESVAARVQLIEANARKLPFGDDSFDVVVSSWALHNIYNEQGRAEAVREIVRVLKPGGRLAIVDIRHGREYALLLRQLGMDNIRRHAPNFLFVIPTFTVTAVKPIA
ncbi:MAG TPA: methyltransferase domain-containing protein, partial [Verrucomicrobiae bacterium]|nr:methyltransferase domain-containing protein [Verrucomicrobiae bacterium]